MLKSDTEQRCYEIFMKSGLLRIEKGFINISDVRKSGWLQSEFPN